VRSSFDYVTIETERHEVSLIGWELPAPKRFRNYPKKGAAVPVIDSRPHEGDLEITHRDACHISEKTTPVRGAVRDRMCLRLRPRLHGRAQKAPVRGP
jgi:hypothetical protein